MKGADSYNESVQKTYDPTMRNPMPTVSRVKESATSFCDRADVFHTGIWLCWLRRGWPSQVQV